MNRGGNYKNSNADGVFGRDSGAADFYSVRARVTNADDAGWLHVAYMRLDPPPTLSPPVVDVDAEWDDASADIYYVGHHESDPLTDWGFEIPLADAPNGAAQFGTLATDGEDVHLLFTQSDGTEPVNLDLMYRKGESIGSVVATGDTAEWNGTVLLEETFYGRGRWKAHDRRRNDCVRANT